MGKTVSLIRLTLVLPGILGGAAPDELQLLDRIAVCWGLTYQIVDDLKDVLHTSAESGKTHSRDVSLGRPNIALAIGIPAAVQRLSRLIVHRRSHARSASSTAAPELRSCRNCASNWTQRRTIFIDTACQHSVLNIRPISLQGAS